MSGKLRVGVLFGGRSGEHEVSLMSARSVMSALDRDKYDVVPIGITKEGRWLPPGDTTLLLQAGNAQAAPVAIVPDPQERGLVTWQPGQASADSKLDVVIPALHGPYGEDGTIQGLLELVGVAYVGAGVLGSALGMDKAVMKAVLRHHGIPTVDFLAFKRKELDQDPTGVVGRVEDALGYPCFVKPANLGSSVCISKVHGRGEMDAALSLAASYDRKIIVERAAEDCREVECAVLGNDEPVASVPAEIVPCHEFYDYAAKYLDDASQVIIPADLPLGIVQEVQRLAVAAFLALDCAGMARVDFFVGRADGRVLVNEINTIPGFTRISAYPKMWGASGLTMTALLDRLIELALERQAERASLRTTYEPG